MPLPMFLSMIALTLALAAATLALAFYADIPLAAFGFAALCGTVLLGLRQWR